MSFASGASQRIQIPLAWLDIEEVVTSKRRGGEEEIRSVHCKVFVTSRSLTVASWGPLRPLFRDLTRLVLECTFMEYSKIGCWESTWVGHSVHSGAAGRLGI